MRVSELLESSEPLIIRLIKSKLDKGEHIWVARQSSRKQGVLKGVQYVSSYPFSDFSHGSPAYELEVEIWKDKGGYWVKQSWVVGAEEVENRLNFKKGTARLGNGRADWVLTILNRKK